jgi:lysophospholipid acyltransferase (LPLAT)-like uncharacterized protein
MIRHFRKREKEHTTTGRKRNLSIRFKGFLFAFLLRVQRRTWRIRIDGIVNLERNYRAGNRLMLCFWHGEYVPILPLLEGYDACVISTLSERGSVIAEICENFGFETARIPDKRGKAAYSLLRSGLKKARAAGLAVDGPLGPYHEVKPAVIRLASLFGFDLLPVSVEVRRKIVLKNRWDCMMIPLPFASVSLTFGEPLKIPIKPDDIQIRELADRLGKKIGTSIEAV